MAFLEKLNRCLLIGGCGQSHVFAKHGLPLRPVLSVEMETEVRLLSVLEGENDIEKKTWTQKS